MKKICIPFLTTKCPDYLADLVKTISFGESIQPEHGSSAIPTFGLFLVHPPHALLVAGWKVLASNEKKIMHFLIYSRFEFSKK